MRLPRLHAPAEAQLVQVRFTTALAHACQALGSNSLLDRIGGWLGNQVQSNQLALHAWALTPSRLLLLLSSPNSGAVSRTVQAIGRRLAAELKTGSVFEGRFKSALIEPVWVLPSQIWLESVPVADGYANQAMSWPWSSAASHVGHALTPRQYTVPVSDHQSYWACGNTPFDRQAIYAAKLLDGLLASQRERIESALSGQWALGSEQYITQISKLASRRVSPGRRGRPPKDAGKPNDPSPLN